MLMIHMKAPTGRSGKNDDRMTERPDVPPKAKWLGVLKKTIAAAVRMRPALSSAKNCRNRGSWLRLSPACSPRAISSGVTRCSMGSTGGMRSASV